MIAINIISVTLLCAITLISTTSLICFFKIFYTKSRKPLGEEEFDLPIGKDYEPFYDQITEWIKSTRKLKHEQLSIKSFDGLTLRGKYYEKIKGAPIEIMFHGYKGTGERDMSGGIERCFDANHNALIVDQRGSGYSDGHVITFGVNESKDCKAWIDFVIEKFGNDVKIILTGISMGGATVLSTTSLDLPSNVKYVLSDCSFSSGKDIIQKVIKDMGLNEKIFYPFVKLGARIFGGFNLEELSPVIAMEKCKLPIIFYHGGKDDYVPCAMSKTIYDKCPTFKKLVVIEDAKHGLAYPADKHLYLAKLLEFEKEINFN